MDYGQQKAEINLTWSDYGDEVCKFTILILSPSKRIWAEKESALDRRGMKDWRLSAMLPALGNITKTLIFHPQKYLRGLR